MQAYKLYDSVHTLTQDRFEDCVCDHNYDRLIIEGEVPAEEKESILQTAWENIFFQYADINRDSETLYIITLKKDIADLDFEISSVECIVHMLSIKEFFRHDLLECLKHFKIRINGIDPSKEDYDLRLKKILALLAPKKMKLADAVKELKNYMNAQDGKETVDREYYSIWHGRLSKFQGYQIRTKEITVAEYQGVMKNFLTNIYSKQKKSMTDGD